MGNCFFKENSDDPLKSSDVPAIFKKDNLLMLGHGGSTTFLKQIILQPSKYPPSPEQAIKDQLKSPNGDDIRKIVTYNIITILRRLEEYGELKDESLRTLLNHQDKVGEHISQCTELFKQDHVKSVIRSLNDESALNFDLNYNMDALFTENYTPSTEDNLRFHNIERKVLEYNFEFKGANIRLIDVGQQPGFSKWGAIFSSVNKIIYFFNLSGYGVRLYEDSSANPVMERLSHFSYLVTNKLFNTIPLIIILTHIDEFKESLKRTSLQNAFSEYEGGDNYEEAIKFMETKLTKMIENREQKVDIFTLNTLDPTQVNTIMEKIIKTQ